MNNNNNNNSNNNNNNNNKLKKTLYTMDEKFSTISRESHEKKQEGYRKTAKRKINLSKEMKLIYVCT